MRIRTWLIYLIANAVVLLFPVDYRLVVSEQATHNIVPIIMAFVFNMLICNNIMIWYVALVLVVNIAVFLYTRRSKRSNTSEG
jgi:hypothetical protein